MTTAPTIRVEPVTLAWIEALAESDETFTKRFGIEVVEGWAGFPEAIPPTLEAARNFAPDRWGSHLIFDDDGALVGFGGWKGPPVEATAELGYTVAPERRGRGIATAFVEALLSRAGATGVELVVAHTLAETSASTRVLQRCGFDCSEEIVDPDDGPIWRWERPL